MSQKTNKAFAKRLKVTKNGKVKSRKPGNNHYNAKESGEKHQTKSRAQNFRIKNKELSSNLPHN